MLPEAVTDQIIAACASDARSCESALVAAKEFSGNDSANDARDIAGRG